MLADFRFAWRSLRSTPAFTIVALVVLTLGIGATTAIYSVVDAVALRGLPFERADRLMLVDETNPTGKGLTGGYVNAANFYDWRAAQPVFEDLAAFQGTGLTVFSNGEPESLRTEMVSASLMPLLKVSPRMGRLFTAENEVAGRNRVALISDSLWRRRFGADPNILGKTLTVGQPGASNPGRNDGAWEVIGVMPPGFEFPVGQLKPFEVWVPYVPSPDEYPRGDGNSRNYNAQVLGRLKDGVTKDQAYAAMSKITADLKAKYPNWFRDRWVGVTPLHESIVGKARGWMFLLLGSVAFVLLIGAGLFVRSFGALTRVNLGIDTAHVLTQRVSPKIDFSRERIDADMARAAVQIADVLERVRAIPGVDVVALASGTSPPTAPRAPSP